MDVLRGSRREKTPERLAKASKNLTLEGLKRLREKGSLAGFEVPRVESPKC